MGKSYIAYKVFVQPLPSISFEHLTIRCTCYSKGLRRPSVDPKATIL